MKEVSLCFTFSECIIAPGLFTLATDRKPRLFDHPRNVLCTLSLIGLVRCRHSEAEKIRSLNFEPRTFGTRYEGRSQLPVEDFQFCRNNKLKLVFRDVLEIEIYFL